MLIGIDLKRKKIKSLKLCENIKYLILGLKDVYNLSTLEKITKMTDRFDSKMVFQSYSHFIHGEIAKTQKCR